MAVSFEDGQVVFDNDLEALSRAIEGTGILSGWTTDPKSPAGMSVDVALGVGYVGSSKKETTETTNVAIAAADSTKARRDIIIWDTSEGELAAVTGTAAAILPYGETDFKKMSHPAPPDIPADDDILIAQVYVSIGTSSIVAADIWEKRYILPFTKQPGAVSGLATLDGSGDVPDAQIPNLAASKITSEQFGLARMPRGTDGYVLTGTGAGTNPAYEEVAYPDFAYGDVEVGEHEAVFLEIGTTYTKRAELTIGKAGNLRIKFKLKSSSTGVVAYGKIYKNDVAVGTERTNSATAYEEFSEDISGWSAGDKVQIYLKGTSPEESHAKDFRLFAGGGDFVVDTF